MNQNMTRENQILNIRVDEIIPNRFQPRLAFNEEELKELSESIKLHGIIQPLVLRRIGDKYEIIAGERRYKASVLAGLNTVPAIIMNMDDKQSAEVAVVENLQRKNLTAIEEAQSYKKILDMGYLTQDELAGRMGVSQPTIANKLRLLNLEKEVQDALLKNQISERHARSLLSITDRNLQINMLNRIIKERLTVRQTDEEINKILGKPINEIPSINQMTKEDVTSSPTPNVTNNQFNTLHQEEKNETAPTTNNIDMLLRSENSMHNNDDETDGNKEIVLENKTMTSPIEKNTVEMAINPFQEVDTEVMSFETPSQTLENPTAFSNVELEKPQNSLIQEFRNQNAPVSPTPQAPIENTPSAGISKAINVARDEARKIEQLGFNVDTEEFDFEDMYQIIIKIKK